MLKLKKGDAVALIAPASGQKPDQDYLVDAAVETLTQWGLDVIQQPEIKAHRYLAAGDALRAQSLIQALTDPDIKAVFVSRGGYGCARLMPYLQALSIPSPRLLIGFSDICSLHLRFQDQDNLYRVHACNIATEQFLGDSEASHSNRQALHDLLFFGVLPDYSLSPLYAAEKRALDFALPKTGGCLSLLVSALGTDYAMDSDNKIVMLEEVAEAPYRIDRMLTQLKQAGQFDRAAGVVLGDWVNCNSPQIACCDVIAEVLSELDCPVYTGAKFGHGALNLPWVYGGNRVRT